jgi:5-methylcytosine-specific restriction endonuclease McrA
MSDAAGWVALAATCIAALMTASNLGARATGWGFVVFTIGALAWIVVGVATKQTQLLWSNVFLGLVDLFGIWRLLGRRAHFTDAANAERERSEKAAGEDLFAMSSIDGMPVGRWPLTPYLSRGRYRWCWRDASPTCLVRRPRRGSVTAYGARRGGDYTPANRPGCLTRENSHAASEHERLGPHTQPGSCLLHLRNMRRRAASHFPA